MDHIECIYYPNDKERFEKINNALYINKEDVKDFIETLEKAKKIAETKKLDNTSFSCKELTKEELKGFFS